MGDALYITAPTRADAGLYFWRTRAGSEVDLVVYGSDVFWAIEVKHAADVRRGDRALEIDGIRCVPCAQFLRDLAPGGALP